MRELGTPSQPSALRPDSLTLEGGEATVLGRAAPPRPPPARVGARQVVTGEEEGFPERGEREEVTH